MGDASLHSQSIQENLVKVNKGRPPSRGIEEIMLKACPECIAKCAEIQAAVSKLATLQRLLHLLCVAAFVNGYLLDQGAEVNCEVGVHITSDIATKKWRSAT